MPTPSGRRSSWRTGGGLTISNALKSIKPNSRDCHVVGAAIRVMSWPATSSMTTNCGSLRLLARATCVAAGIPTRNAVRANRAAAQGCQLCAIQRATSHHSRTVAAEPQVPGPGRRYPTPKKVATIVAQRGASLPPSGILIGLSGDIFDVIAVLYWRRDDIPAAGPFAQVNQAAAVATERELGVLAGHGLLADGALQLDLASHVAFLHDLIFRRSWRLDRSRGPR